MHSGSSRAVFGRLVKHALVLLLLMLLQRRRRGTMRRAVVVPIVGGEVLVKVGSWIACGARGRALTNDASDASLVCRVAGRQRGRHGRGVLQLQRRFAIATTVVVSRTGWPGMVFTIANTVLAHFRLLSDMKAHISGTYHHTFQDKQTLRSNDSSSSELLLLLLPFPRALWSSWWSSSAPPCCFDSSDFDSVDDSLR
jgi:hypothetical protein